MLWKPCKALTISRLSDAIVKTDSPALVTRLTNLELERKKFEEDYQEAVADNMSRTDVKADYKNVMSKLKTGLKDNAFRLSLRNLMRKHISEIIVKHDSYKVNFTNTDEHLVIHLDKDTFSVSMWDETEVFTYTDFENVTWKE